MKAQQPIFTFIDLFSGIGGFRLALNNLGGACLNFSEINKDAINTYCTNFNEDSGYNLGDITKIRNLPKHDLLTAGVPCQSWSIAGRNLGFDDDRGQLWNDTIYLLHKSRPKAFIFENVKGLADPRNKEALRYILNRIKAAGYYAGFYVLNSFDYGVPQNRVRIYIVGFLEEKFYLKFKVAKAVKEKIRLADIIADAELNEPFDIRVLQKDLFDQPVLARNMSLSNNKGFNDYFLFNDLRNGHSTVHSWDIFETTDRQKAICYLLLKNRRKSAYGHLDGNPLSLKHFQALDKSIEQPELDELVKLRILSEENYAFSISNFDWAGLGNDELTLLNCAIDNQLNIDLLKSNRSLKLNKVNIAKSINSLSEKGILVCSEIRYDFKNTKISTGLNGINRVFLPSSNIFPTLVASDSNDFVALRDVNAPDVTAFKHNFIEQIYKPGLFRKITKQEACMAQGFPKGFLLPDSRARWMKLLGNSVSVPVVQMLGKAIAETGVFQNDLENENPLNQSEFAKSVF
ncbi:MAG: DNA cytosine methyltransferase [Saprospiraceae bacterium]